jgi:hypothetical protein
MLKRTKESLNANGVSMARSLACLAWRSNGTIDQNGARWRHGAASKDEGRPDSLGQSDWQPSLMVNATAFK